MTLRPAPLLDALAQSYGCAARTVVRRAALMVATGGIAAVGFGFLVVAALGALRLLVRPELAALALGTILLVLAGLMARFVPRFAAETPPVAAAPPDATSSPADPATLAVFTAAFVLGRRLADRWRG